MVTAFVSRTICASIVVLTLLSGIGGASNQKTRKSKPNRPPIIAKFEATTHALGLCPWQGSAACPSETGLTVIARDPDGDKLNYRYSCTAGRVAGNGPEVIWAFENDPRGPQSARVIVDDGRGGEARANLQILLTDCSGCDPPPPPCPTIQVSCPDAVESSKTIRFDVKIIGKSEPYATPSIKWSVAWGKIVKGQFTNQIEVQPTDREEEVRATVEVAGIEPSCITTASCSVKLKQRSP